ncbi:MAG: oligosaccharide flippase family protein, partial [Vicinamibacterales bacterium]
MERTIEPVGRVPRSAVAIPVAPPIPASATGDADGRRGGFTRRYLTLFGGEVVSKLCVFAAFAYLARVLGPNGFGLIELALSITLFFVMAVDGGLGSYGARVVSASPDEAPRLLARITAIRVVAAAIAYVPLLLVSLFYGQPGVGLLAVYGLAVFFVPFFNHWLFQGFRTMHLVATGTALRNVVFAALVFGVVRPGADLRLVAVAEVAGVAALAAFTTLTLRRIFRIRPDVRGLLRGATGVLRESWPLGASEVTWAALWYSPGIILGALSTTEQLAWLAGPLRIVLALH